MYNKAYSPIFEKKNLFNPSEKSSFQVFQTTMTAKSKGDILSFKDTCKTHVAMLEKIFIPLYLENIYFLVNRAE